MPPSKSSNLTLSPSWPHYAGVGVTLLAIVAGLGRYLLLDRLDPMHCGALTARGSWLDSNRKNWQPDGCMLHQYPANPGDGATCLKSRDVVFLGDSVTRKLFFQMAHTLDSALPTAPLDDEQKHSDHSLQTNSGTRLLFYWDPFLNSSHSEIFLSAVLTRDKSPMTDSTGPQRPALLVLGSGLWYLRYAETSGGLPAWEAKMDSLMNFLSRVQPADKVVVLPIEEIVPSKLSRERADSLHSSDIDAMNSDLLHRINPSSGDYLHLFSQPPPPIPVSLPLVFNLMLDASETEDGLHFSDSVVKLQANILLNLRCNDELPKQFPLDKTCCRSYPWPSVLQLVILVSVIIWGPFTLFASQPSGKSTRQRLKSLPTIKDEQIPALVLSTSVALIFLADRTGLWLKEQKQFEPWTFAFLCFIALGVGLATVKRADKELGFLNREQTDEWKGWMQLAILIYHYLGASKISGVYNPIRVLVASYLFMTGYGHTTFYLRKADFGFLRVAQVLVRLNLFTLLLAYTMNTDYISYYFSPLVSLWFLIIWGTMAAGSQFNDRTAFLVCKLLLSAGLVTWFMGEPWPLQTLFQFLSQFCGIHWSAREWSFRVNLDIWIVYVGMFTSLAVVKMRELRLTDHPQWPLAVKVSMGASAFGLVWFFAFELLQESKFTYNLWHPYVSAVPVLAFMVLRNANVIMRSANSRAFAFVGTCSLETFIIQYHFWLAGDTKGVLLVLPGTEWRPANFVITSIMFIYISHMVARATTDVTKWICSSGPPKSLPLPATADPSSSRQPTGTGEESSIPLLAASGHVDKDDTTQIEVPPRQRWVDRLAEGSSPVSAQSRGFRIWYGENEWNPGVASRIGVTFVLMWVLNVLWR